MKRKRYAGEQIAFAPRQAESGTAQRSCRKTLGMAGPKTRYRVTGSATFDQSLLRWFRATDASMLGGERSTRHHAHALMLRHEPVPAVHAPTCARGLCIECLWYWNAPRGP